MKCPECGSEVAPGEQFCGNCGAPVEAEKATSSDETVLSEAIELPPIEPEAPPVADPSPDLPEFPPPPPPPPPVPGGGGKSKKGLIIGIIVAVVLLLCCCCIIAIAVFLKSEAGTDLMDELGITMVPFLAALI